MTPSRYRPRSRCIASYGWHEYQLIENWLSYRKHLLFPLHPPFQAKDATADTRSDWWERWRSDMAQVVRSCRCWSNCMHCMHACDTFSHFQHTWVKLLDEIYFATSYLHYCKCIACCIVWCSPHDSQGADQQYHDKLQHAYDQYWPASRQFCGSEWLGNLSLGYITMSRGLSASNFWLQLPAGAHQSGNWIIHVWQAVCMFAWNSWWDTQTECEEWLHGS